MKNLNIFVFCLLILLSTGKLTATKCSSADEESVLHPGYDYSYRYESYALAEAVGTTNDKSKISIQCDVKISHASDCFYNFRLDHCSLTATGGAPGSETSWMDQQPLPDLSKYALKFLLIGGEVKEVYTDDHDPIHFVNIKRGALSAFVFKLSSTTRHFKEMHTDIHGICPMTSFPLDTSEGTVKTRKDMLHCSFPSKRDWQYSPFSMFWNMSFIQNVINSTADCNYSINLNEKIINKVSCKERHAIMLESSHSTAVAVQTNIYYTVSFVKSSLQTTKEEYSSTRKTGIQFEYERTPDPRTDNPDNFLRVAKNMLSNLVEDSKEEIRLSTITQFTDFVAYLRSSQNLRNFIESVKSCDYLTGVKVCSQDIKDLGMSYLKDALVQCNSLPCIEAISHLARFNDISPAYLKFIYFSWSNMHFEKPAILKYIMNMCIDTDSNLCWMSIGSLIRRTYATRKDLEEEELEKLQEIARYFPNSLREKCLSGKSTPDMHEKLVKDLKAISNMGEIYLLLIPEGYHQLTECLFISDTPIQTRISTLEAIKSINPCQDDASCGKIYKTLLPLLLNENETTTLRTLSYDYLVRIPQKYGYEGDVFNILKSDKNFQLKSYIANSLKSLFKDSLFKEASPKFIRAMTQLLTANELTLDSLIHLPESKSSSAINGLFVDLPFMPHEMRRFGLRATTSKVYEQSDVVPRYFHTDFFIRMFSQLLDFFETRIYSEGLEDLAIIFQKIMKDNLNPEAFSYDKIFNALQEVAKEFQPDTLNSGTQYKFDESILKNIKKLEEMYRKYKPKSTPFFNIFLDLFGTTISYVSSGDISALTAKLLEMRTLMKDLKDGLNFNTTRVIRVIEAYHQVPTMMGLPLNWTTNATLAFSVRSGLKVEFNYETFELHSSGSFQPSAALTFLNRMVLDFPTITQIGVQANSSGYSSTQLQVKLEYSKEKKLLSIMKPSKTQKILELFRTNQLIKHNDYIDLADWDIERTASDWCTDEGSSSLLGLQFCLSKSYPHVTQRLKPWALMSGWCKWKLNMAPFDEKLESYDVQIVKLPGIKNKELIVTFSTSGSENRREITFEGNSDEVRGEIEYNLKITENPNYHIQFKKIRLMDKSRDIGLRIISFLKLQENNRYEIIYDEKITHEELTESHTGLNESPKNQKVNTLTKEKILSFSTPSNLYRFREEVYQENGESVKRSILLSYENSNPNNKWLHLILPASFWENQSKAWIEFQINWKERSGYSTSITRQTICFIKDPQFIVELDARSLETAGRQQVNLNLTKSERSNSKILAFANFTYDFWGNPNNEINDKQIQLFNLTISRKSWAAKVKKIKEADKLLYEISLARAVMQPQNVGGNYVGWWSKEASEAYNLQEHEIKLVVDTDTQMMSRQELVDRYSLPSHDIKGLRNQLIKAKIRFEYPFIDEKEWISFDGYFVLSKGPTTFRFQKNFVMESSYNKLQLTTHSVYRAEDEITTLYHQSFFTHVPSQTKSFNTIEYKRTYPTGECMEVEFKHDIRSFFFDLSSNISYKCNSNGKDLHTLLLDLKSNSSYWHMLNTSIEQIIEDKNPEYRYETCNVTHPLLTINVTADWEGVGLKDHKKKAIFTSRKNGGSSELNIHSLHDGKLRVKLKMPNDERRLSFERRISSDDKNINIVIKYGNTTEQTDETKDLHLSGQILNENLHIWTAKINIDTYSKIKSLMLKGYETTSNNIVEIAKDSHHPVNELLAPTLKVTLYKYWKSLLEKRNNFMLLLWKNVRDTARSLKPFFDTPLSFLNNLLKTTIEISFKYYETLKEKSVIIWAIDYFNLPSYFYMGLANLHKSMGYFINMFLPEDRVLEMEFVTGRILEWESFKEWPRIAFEEVKSKVFQLNDQAIAPNHGKATQSKIAMIFGARSIYTFDEKVYDAAEYESNCTFLLAHDLRKSQFTVLSDRTSIHVLFPEMVIQVNDKDEVFVNGSKVPSRLPMTSYNGKVVVRKGSVLEIWSPSLRIICNGKYFMCLFELDKWHSGGTFGLLGNADGSLNNENLLPDGNITASALEFIKSYEVSGNMECKTLRLHPRATSSPPAIEACSNKFRGLCLQKRTLQNAFKETCQSEYEEDPNACYASAAYSALCYYKHQPSTLECGESGPLQKRILHRLEVVLIVQEHYSLTVEEKKTAPYKGIERLLSSLNDKFKANGYSEVLFSLIGFGGKGLHYQPTMHTKGRNLWMSLQTFLNDELKSLEFNGHKDINPLDALKYASEVVGLNTFNSKIFIILTERDKQGKNKNYINTIQNQLEKNGITLFTISTYPTIEKGKKVFGVRADGLIFPSPKKNGTSHLGYPKGDLAKLTSATRGSIFLSKFLIFNNPPSFFGEFADEVWSKINKESQSCRQCSKKSTWWWQDLECRIRSCE